MTLPIDPMDVAFMRAVERSEDLLAQLEDGWRPPCSSAALERVRDDAFRAIASDLPDPAAYAASLTPDLAAAIAAATHGRDGGLWVEPGPCVPLLRSLGLITISDRALTGFGYAVRRVLRREEGFGGEPGEERGAVAAGGQRPAQPPRMVRAVKSAPAPRETAHTRLAGQRVEHHAPCWRCGARIEACGCKGAAR